MKIATILVILLSFILISMNLASAVQQFQVKEFPESNNKTTLVRGILSYSTTDTTKNFIKSSNPLQLYILYDTSIETWNIDNPSYHVSYCNLRVYKVPLISNGSILIFNRTYFDDNKNLKFFINLKDGETATSEMSCIFTGIRPTVLELPADTTYVIPTQGCRACQELQWSEIEVTLSKTASLNQFINDNFDTIKQFVSLNYEFWIIMFWTGLIILLLMTISLIFTAIYWVYLVIKKHTT